MNLNNLNEEQKKAVMQTNGPLLVLAGAGSGKTRVLTMKIAYLIEQIKINPRNILAITFTNKAALEMKTRVTNIIGDVANQIQISTFHSFGVKIICENYNHLGYSKNISILDSDDSLTIIKRIIKSMNLDPKIYNPNSIRYKISGCKNEMVGPKEYSNYANSEYEEIVCKVYEEYEKQLKESNAVDFDDLLILPIELFKKHNEILQKYQERFKYILIDEYQDTNQAQYILTKLISMKYKNICCVGDNDQSIYGFRGANYKNILNFEKDFKDAKVIKLEQNYRSTTNILDAANSVIKHNQDRKEKVLWSNNGEGSKITYHTSFTEKDEAKYVAKKIEEMIHDNIEYKEIAVLYRTNAQSRAIEEALLQYKYPYRVVGSIYFYSRKEIKDLIAYLRLINNTDDNISLQRVINTPKRGIGDKAIENLKKKASEKNVSLFDAIEDGKEKDFKNLIIDLQKSAAKTDLITLIDNVLELTGLKQEYEKDSQIEKETRLENLEEFKSVAKNFQEKYGIASLEDFLIEISLVSDMSEYKDTTNVISLMTVHSVKGLEFDNVFIVGLEEGMFPHMNSMMDQKELEEERRLCYVAITRARKNLYLVNARIRTIFGKEQSYPASRFIEEIDKRLLQCDNKKEQPKPKEEYYNKDEVEYHVGDNVYHTIFGLGKIIEIENDLLCVAFHHPYGIKKVMPNHKNIQKM